MPGGTKYVLTDTTQNGRTESPAICGGPPLKMAPTRLEGDVCRKEVLLLKYWRQLKKKNWRLFLGSDDKVDTREWSLIFPTHRRAGLREHEKVSVWFKM